MPSADDARHFTTGCLRHLEPYLIEIDQDLSTAEKTGTIKAEQYEQLTGENKVSRRMGSAAAADVETVSSSTARFDTICPGSDLKLPARSNSKAPSNSSHSELEASVIASYELDSDSDTYLYISNCMTTSSYNQQATTHVPHGVHQSCEAVAEDFFVPEHLNGHTLASSRDSMPCSSLARPSYKSRQIPQTNSAILNDEMYPARLKHGTQVHGVERSKAPSNGAATRVKTKASQSQTLLIVVDKDEKEETFV